MPDPEQQTTTAEAAAAAVAAAAVEGKVAVCSTTRHGTREVPFSQTVEWASTVIAEAQQLVVELDDPRGLQLHVTSDGGRLYRMKAQF
jgi:phosphotransacetylase